MSRIPLPRFQAGVKLVLKVSPFCCSPLRFIMSPALCVSMCVCDVEGEAGIHKFKKLRYATVRILNYSHCIELASKEFHKTEVISERGHICTKGVHLNSSEACEVWSFFKH